MAIEHMYIEGAKNKYIGGTRFCQSLEEEHPDYCNPCGGGGVPIFSQ